MARRAEPSPAHLLEARNRRGMDAIAALPASVRVGAHDIAIVPMSIHSASGRRIWGRFEAAAQTIEIQQLMPTSAMAVETLLHEIGHAIWWSYGMRDSWDEEQTVAVQATAWAQVWRDNPLVLDWVLAWGLSDG